MSSDESAIEVTNGSPFLLSPIPIALYEVNGLIYQLYAGGQARQSFVIRWQRLKTLTVSRETNVGDVQINQGRRQHISDQHD